MLLLFSQACHASQQQGDPPYNHLFDIQNIEGGVVYINKKDLADHPEQMAAALDHFRSQLYQARLNVPAPALLILPVHPLEKHKGLY